MAHTGHPVRAVFSDRSGSPRGGPPRRHYRLGMDGRAPLHRALKEASDERRGAGLGALGRSGTGAGEDTGESRGSNREASDRKTESRLGKDRNRRNQVCRRPDRSLKCRVTVTIIVRKGRNGGQGRAGRARHRLRPRVQLVRELSMCNRMPDLPPRLNRACQDQQCNGSGTQAARLGHDDIIVREALEWQTRLIAAIPAPPRRAPWV